MVLDLPQRVPGLAGKTSLYAEVRLPRPSQYPSNRNSWRAHWYLLWAKANEHTYRSNCSFGQTKNNPPNVPCVTHLPKKSTECNFKYENKKQMWQEKWEIGFCSSHIQQIEYTCIHALCNCFTWLTCNQNSLSAHHRYTVFNILYRKYIQEIYSDSSDFNPSLKETPALLNQWDTLHGFWQSHYSLFPAVHANTSLITFILRCLCSRKHNTWYSMFIHHSECPTAFSMALLVGLFLFPYRISATPVTLWGPWGASSSVSVSGWSCHSTELYQHTPRLLI